MAETDSLRDPATSGYVLNMALTELHSAVPTLAALGSPFYDISSQLSFNLPTQDLGFTPVQSPYELFSLPPSPYNPLPFLEEMDTIPFKRQESPSISLVRATAFQKLIDQGNKVFTLSYRPVSLPKEATQLQAVENNPAPPTSLHAKPLPTDEGELIAKVVPPECHDFFDVFSREEAKLMPPHQPYDHTIDLENNQHLPTATSTPCWAQSLASFGNFWTIC